MSIVPSMLPANTSNTCKPCMATKPPAAPEEKLVSSRSLSSGFADHQLIKLAVSGPLIYSHQDNTICQRKCSQLLSKASGFGVIN